jgi:5-methylcytosine-specific restriction endonuclease McrA
MLKTCTKCHEVKPLSEFSKDVSSRDGKQHRCKECAKVAHRNYKASYKGKAVQALSNSRADKREAEKLLGNPIKDTLNSEQIAFVLSTGECIYCKTDLSYKDATIDHVISMRNGGENTYENIVCACGTCNRRKNDKPVLVFLREYFNHTQLRRVVDRLATRQGKTYFRVWGELEADVFVYEVTSSV